MNASPGRGKAGEARPYNALSGWLKAAFGRKVFRVSLDAGLSCPNRDGSKGYGGCLWCSPQTLLPAGFSAGQDISAQLTSGMERVRARRKAEAFIAYFQFNTSTHAAADRLRPLFEAALAPEVAALAISTRPDCLGEDVLDLLCELRSRRHLWLELGLQSSSDSSLAAMNRGHAASEFADAALRAASRGIDVCAHAIIGLPGQGRSEALDTMAFIAGLPVWGVKFHQLQVLAGSGLETAWRRGEVSTLRLEDYASLVVECLERLPAGVVIHRLAAHAPRRMLLAPQWGASRFEVIAAIEALLKERGTFQGALCRP